MNISKSIVIPKSFINNFVTHNQQIENTPISSIVYDQIREDCPSLVRILCEEMKQCPFNNIRLNFEELSSLNRLRREITLIGKINIDKNKDKDEDKEKLFKQFKERLDSSLSQTDEFAYSNIDKIWNVHYGKTIGDEFTSPMLYDINANLSQMRISVSQDNMTMIILWKEEEAFSSIADSLKHRIHSMPQLNIISVSLVEHNFFKRKEFLMTHSKSLPNATHYFEGEPTKAFFTYNNQAPWIIILDNNRIIRYDSIWEGQDCIKIINRISQSKQVEIEVECSERNKEYLNANDYWWSASNKTKEHFIQIVDEELTEREMNDIEFTMYSQMIIDKRGIRSKLVKPQLAGSIEAEFKELLNEFIVDLGQNGQLHQISIQVSYETA